MLEPPQEGNITVRVPRSTRNLTISAAFRSSTLNQSITGRGFNYIGSRDDRWLWWSIGDTAILVGEFDKSLGFGHRHEVTGNILVTSLVGDISSIPPGTRILLQTSPSIKPNTKTEDLVYSIETYEEREEGGGGDSNPLEILGLHNTGNWPAESESDMIQAVCKATNLGMTEIPKWTLDEVDFPFKIKHTKYTQTTATTDSEKALYRVEQEILIDPRIQFNGKYLKCEVKDTVKFATVQIFVNLKIRNLENQDFAQMDVLEGQNKIAWHLARTNSLESAECTFNGQEFQPSSKSSCSKYHSFSSSRTIQTILLGMTAPPTDCSTYIDGIRTVSIKVLKAPNITMRIRDQVMRSGEKGSFKEGTLLELRCNAGVSDVRSYTWWIGDERLNYNSSSVPYSAKSEHNTKILKCSVDHRAFDNDIYNNKFITPNNTKPKNSVEVTMNIQFQATNFKLNSDHQGQVVNLPFESKYPQFTLETMLNPEPLRAWLAINGDEYPLSEGNEAWDIKTTWNQKVNYWHNFDQKQFKLETTVRLTEVRRDTSARVSLIVENEVETSTFDFTVKVKCPEPGVLCANSGTCEEIGNDITCNCDGTQYYGDSCENSCLPESDIWLTKVQKS